MRLLSAACIALLCHASAFAQEAATEAPPAAAGPQDFLVKAVVGPQDDGTYVVPTVQIVSPAGQTVQFPGRPVDLALSPDGATVAVKNRTDLVFIDAASKTVRQTLPFPKGGATFVGLAWSRDGKKVWVTDTKSFLRSAAPGDGGQFAWADEIVLPGPEGEKTPNAAAGGFVLDEDAGVAYVTLSRNNTVAVVNLASKAVDAQIPVGMAPYTIVVKDRKAYVTNWGGRRPVEGDFTSLSSGSKVVVDEKTGIVSTGTVSVVDLDARQATGEIAVGLHPCGMAFSPDKARLYVANANSDTISVIDTATDAVVDTFSAKPLDALPFGSAPNALAVSPDGAALYAALGGNNAIAVVDLAAKKVKGLIPTGWYPGAVLIAGDGTLVIANTKGIGSRSEKANRDRQGTSGTPAYNSRDHSGSVTFTAVPGDEELARHTERVATNMRLPLMRELMNLPKAEEKVVPVPTRPGERSVFKHVIYIIKENRTYDQVFGDLPQGNGDASLCHFPREVTPNHHALVEQFVLLDNFYCNGVLSADGHQWTNEGYVTDYLEKSFGDFVRSYPYEGDDALAFAPTGFIWDYVLKKGLTFRNYGEFVAGQVDPKGATWTEIYQDYLNDTRTVKIWPEPALHTLKPYVCPTVIGFPMVMQDVYRAKEFIKELKDFEAKGEFPNFTIMLLPNDHTAGTKEGMPTPRAMVADNDLALGRIVEAVSHSRFWPETVIFVVQDDPQAGVDHVDGHRTVALCVSPYTKRGFVDSTFYTQTSMLRTMELVMDLPPMNQLTMAANPMVDCFQPEANPQPYTALPNIIPLDEMNPAVVSLSGAQRHFAELSMRLPLEKEDLCDEDTLNRIVWHSVKGYDTPYPQLARRPEAGPNAWPAAQPVDED